jgi:chorismate dehydratase
MLYGIKRHKVLNRIDLIEDYPSSIAKQLIKGQIDIGLIPVAAIPYLTEAHIVTDFCIGCEGPVASVCIFSEVPIEEVKTVYLDYQSRTSVNLAKVLLREYWKKDVVLIDAKGEEYRHEIKGTTAGVVIGDRALQQRHVSKYIYDLGETWIKHTGLPFVFAAWIANKKLPEGFIVEFNEANALGFQHLDDVIKENPYAFFDLEYYYKKSISYQLTQDKRKGMRLFLEKISLVTSC